MLKSVTSFAQDAALGGGSGSGKMTATHADGVVISSVDDEQIQKIDIDADQETFER